MISRCLLLTLFVIALTPGFLHSQQAYPTGQQQRFELTFTLTQTLAAQNEKMYEDIEILRRILDRKLTPLYPSVPSKGERTDPTNYYGTLSGPQDVKTGSLLVTRDGPYQIDLGWSQPANPGVLMFDANMPYPAAIPFRSLEGIYLKGQGVVYTATLSSLEPPAKAEADSTVNQLLRAVVVPQDSEWDSIRRQERHEKEEPKKPEASKPPSLSDVLLKVLADNGHNFSQLGENESLTIVLTVHEASPTSSAAKSGTGSAKAAPKPENYLVAPNVRIWQRDIELLGELHLKQGKYEEAIEVFHKELEQTKNPKRQAELLRKLAQCHLMQGQDEKARNELDKAIILMKKGTEAKDKPAADVKPAAALPVKLIISAPKKLLDQVKAGKISFEDFRRQASVETLRFGDRR